MAIDISKVLELPVDERIELVQQIWDSIAEIPEVVKLTGAQSRELERRLKAYESDPSAGSPWADVRERLLPE